MEKSYFKNIYEYLSNKHPNKKVYVISDHHFYHGKILEYVRTNFADVYQMNNYIIQEHNAVVTSDDIVIFLGDFCFKNSEIKNILAKLNGIKYIVLGNHDGKFIMKKFSELGFEDVFLYPVSFGDNYLSHYPLKGVKPEEVLYHLLENEFSKKKEKVNYHGHEHVTYASYENSQNVSLENVGYKPVFIGYTSGKLTQEDSPLIITSDYFSNILNFLTDSKKMNKDLLLSDFIYSYILANLSNPNVFYNGSYTYFIKYGLLSRFSDLDASLIFDENKSKKQNQEILKATADEVFFLLKDLPGFNLSYLKRMPGICLLDIFYLGKNNQLNQSYFDINLILENVYREGDFEYVIGKSTLEKMIRRYFFYDADYYSYPSFNAKVLTSIADFANLTLQFLYQNGFDEKKPEILRKIREVVKHIKPEDYPLLEDTLIRFLIRNILFFYSVRRTKDIDFIRKHHIKIYQLLNSVPIDLRLLLEHIFLNEQSEYNLVFNEIFKVNNKLVNSSCTELIRARK